MAKNGMIMDCSMDRAQYILGETCILILSVSRWPEQEPDVALYSMQERIVDDWEVTRLNDGKCEFRYVLGRMPVGNYGVTVNAGGETASTAFDVVAQHKDVFRYGFLSNFSDGDGGSDDVDWLRRLHINAVQFYDWMYKHDDLIAPANRYKDPLGRDINLGVITEKIQACKESGIRPFAYGAVYAANRELFEQHPEWALYTMDGQPMMFFDWLYFMNVSEECPWSKYIVSEYTRAMTLLGFSGIHMDTYGFPKTVWNRSGEAVALAESFSKLIDSVSAAAAGIDGGNGVIFNAVNNWPVESIAKSAQDAVYIEVWPPHSTYYDLYTLIREARYLSGKNVVLAAYMEPFKDAATEQQHAAAEISLLLANAVIYASGGTQLVYGECKCVLCDSYYVNHARLRESFLEKVRAYSDFLVWYAPLLYADGGMDVSKTAANGINTDICFASQNIVFSSDGKPGTVWTIVRESEKRLTIHLINLTGNNGLWNEPKTDPAMIGEITVRILQDRTIKGIWSASPDCQDIRAKSLSYETERTGMGRTHTVKLPPLHLWNTVWLEMM